jgi:superfamily II DNA or RNA helicase
LGFSVNKSTLGIPVLKKLKTDLTLIPYSPQTEFFVKPSPIEFYYEYEDVIYIPRQFGMNRFGRNVQFDDLEQVKDWPHTIAFNGQLKDLPLFSQQVACDSAIRDLRTTGGSLLSLPTGTGKTACALYIMAQMAVKVAVVVHKEPLLHQWKERIHQFLPEARVGTIQGPNFDVDDKDIVIIMLQSVTKRDYVSDIFQQFGMVVFDEVHHLSARVFSQVFHKLTRPFMLGLSATLQRKDRTDIALQWFIGPISMEVKLVDNTVSVKTVYYKNDLAFKDLPISKGGKLNFTALITLITEIEERNQFIVKILHTLKNRNVIVMSDRRKHCVQLHDIMRREGTAGLVLIGGSMPTSEEISQSNLFFATYSLCAEGLDIPKLDCLLLASPKADVVQATGRIMRTNRPDNIHPLVVDIVDHCGPLFAQYFKRKAFYNASDFSLQT